MPFASELRRLEPTATAACPRPNLVTRLTKFARVLRIVPCFPRLYLAPVLHSGFRRLLQLTLKFRRLPMNTPWCANDGVLQRENEKLGIDLARGHCAEYILNTVWEILTFDEAARLAVQRPWRNGVSPRKSCRDEGVSTKRPFVDDICEGPYRPSTVLNTASPSTFMIGRLVT
jgi:hypothetical protein